MYALALATDYDGTLADHGTVSDTAYEALQRFAKTGRKLILVTGREVDDLKEVFPGLKIFDLIVAENGAVLYRPRGNETRVLAPKPSKALVDWLEKRKVKPLHVGASIVATREPHETVALEAIRELGLELEIIFNKGAVMILPTGINKATGLAAALEELEFSPHNVVAVGDAQNDHALLQAAGCGVAVENALAQLKKTADRVTKGARSDGVVELIDDILQKDGRLFSSTRHLVPIGAFAKGKEAKLSPYGGGVLIAGTSGTGKSTLATAIMEAFAEREFQFCVVDPEGDYEELESSVMVGGPDRPPNEKQIFDLLAKPTNNVVINLVGVKVEDRPAFFAGLAPKIAEMRARTGRPHWLLVDEAHHLMPVARDGSSLAVPRSNDGTIMVTVHPDLLSTDALEGVETVVAVGSEADKVVASVAKLLGVSKPKKMVPVKKGKALFWSPREDEKVRHIDLVEPKQKLKRHRRKYAEGDLGDHSFYFRGPDEKLNLKAQNLMTFVQIAEGIDDKTWKHHLRAGDYSDWFRRYVKDKELAEVARSIEQEIADPAESRSRIIEAVRSRYTAAAA